MKTSRIGFFLSTRLASRLGGLISWSRASGFTLVELLVAAGIMSGVLVWIFSVFIYGSRTAAKGTGLLTAINDLTMLQVAIRKDCLGSREVKAEGGRSLLPPGPVEVPLEDPGIGKSGWISFSLADRVVRYSMVDSSNGTRAIERREIFPPSQNQQDLVRLFADSRVKGFRACVWELNQRLFFHDSPTHSRHLFFEILLQSDEKTGSNRPLRFAAVSSPPGIARRSWNLWVPEPGRP